MIAQENTCSKKWYIKPAFNYGFILQHRAAMGHLITGYVPMGELNLVKATDGCKMWQLENNKPDFGLSATFMDFGNPKVLGYSLSLSPFVEIPLTAKARPSTPILRISWGLAYVTKCFDIVDNHKNIAIGSHWNAFVQYRFQWNINLSKKFRFEPGIGISHVSNGRFQVPNLGLNLVSVNLGLTYKINDLKCEKTTIDSSTKVPSRQEILVWGAFGINDNYPPGNAKMNAYTLSFNYFYNVRNTSKLGLGADIYYEESYL
ncbi:MAG TPA: acyloxyacyl hydrolase, partial [Bacteroidia bacterium]|nr:acyloxyacyl hydrolase [Bacteroidia bacterium]